MTTYVLPPGAWLSGSALYPGIGGLYPGIGGLYPGIGGLYPGIGGQYPGIGGQYPGIGGQYPGIGGQYPGSGKRSAFPPPDSQSPMNQAVGAQAAERLASAAARLTVAGPWRGDHPAWVYEAPSAMLAEAIDRTRSRLVLDADPRREGNATSVVAARLDEPDEDLNAIWRWSPESRAQAVLADLNWRFAVSDSCLWYLNRTDEQGRRVSFDESISFAEIPTDSDWYARQIDKVLRAAVEREYRLPEILSQMDDFMPFFSSLIGVREEVAPITYELLSIAQRWATPLVMALKNQLAARRPDLASTRVVPVIPTPGHGSLPSGHATVAALMSRLIARLMFANSALLHPKVVQLDRLARRIAFNRVVAGVHFPVDSRAGHALGLQMSAHLIGLAEGSPQPIRYDLLFDVQAADELKEEGTPQALTHRRRASSGVAESPVLGVLWRAANRELARLGVEEVQP